MAPDSRFEPELPDSESSVITTALIRHAPLAESGRILPILGVEKNFFSEILNIGAILTV